MLPSHIEQAVFLMNPPLSYTNLVPNNVWMDELPEGERHPSQDQAMAQWLDLYSYVASQALVYLLPTPTSPHLQDLTFVANLGIVLGHGDQPVFVSSNYTSAPRRGEADVGIEYFSDHGYAVRQPASKFEGEADLKHLHDNIYVGGYGQRTQQATHHWLADTFDAIIIPVEMNDPRLYHLDCTVLPLTYHDTLVCTEQYTTAELTALAEHTNVIDVTTRSALAGITNCVRLHHSILCATDIHDLDRGSEDYDWEHSKLAELERITDRLGFELVVFNLSEFTKAGALLSCLMLHLNRWSYRMDPA